MKKNPLTSDLLHKMNAYWRAANYLSVGQIYLYDNPLSKRLALADVKHMMLGNWCTTPGQNFIYLHLKSSPTTPIHGSRTVHRQERSGYARKRNWKWSLPHGDAL